MTICLTFSLGFAALAVDLSKLYAAQSELQRVADAAALAGASQLGGNGEPGDPMILAREEADRYARLNDVFRVSAGIGEADFELGQAVYNEAAGRFEFQPGGGAYDAVRVTARRTTGSEGGPIPLIFARLWGYDTQGLRASAAAMLVPRDIAVVIDLSNSMCWDSQLRFYNRSDGGYANTRDIWCALNGPEPQRPYVPGSELETEYAGDTGPAVGDMNTWGSPLVPGYSSGSDPGLWYIKRYTNTSNATISANLTARGYSADEKSILMSASRDGTTSHWRYRCAVMLGLAEWRSGRPGGRAGGDGDAVIESGEITWDPYPSWRVSWSWTEYIDWVQSNSLYNSMPGSPFRYRYGLKTFVDFLLEVRPMYRETNILWATPEEPLRAVKDAVQSFADYIQRLNGLDHVSLEVFATSSRHEVNLTEAVQQIPDALYARQSGHYDRATCIGCGLAEAIAELRSPRARDTARKVIILMSDGTPNIDSGGNYVGDSAPGAIQYALDKAREAADLGFQIHTISVGYIADRELMQQIASIGGGLEFYAVGNPEEYSEQLEQIFRSLGGARPVTLIE